jgi:DNA (cytosine-5)-methyltransferase 1
VSDQSNFTYVDLFSGIGGFHAALSAFGGKCLFASEIDVFAARVYERNWGLRPAGDINDYRGGLGISERIDVLAAGFPCQPFSKSGKQLGRQEDRGTLIDCVIDIAAVHTPTVIILENVRNLAGPRHRSEFEHICNALVDIGYQVRSEPNVFSPHLINTESGGRPQIRERVFITATYTKTGGVLTTPLTLLPETLCADPSSWDLDQFMGGVRLRNEDYQPLTIEETAWITAWNEFQCRFRREYGRQLPGFPLWADEWVATRRRTSLHGLPDWKEGLMRKNWQFYETHSMVIQPWLKEFRIHRDFPPSRRKFEWQAQDARSIWSCLIQFRPSGIRVKKTNYLPAFVAMNQTSIVGPRRRRITFREAARLQGLPDWFDFGDQPLSQTFKQLGNGVNVGVVWQVMRSHVIQEEKDIARSSQGLTKAVIGAPQNSDNQVESLLLRDEAA